MTKDERKVLRDLANQSTLVNAWYPHHGGKDSTAEATVRGPFNRWFKCTNIELKYSHHVAEDYDDCRFAAAAMNNLVPLLDEVDRLEAETKKLRALVNKNAEACEGLSQEIDRLCRAQNNSR